MPFSRYLQSNERDGQNSLPNDEELDHHAFSSSVQFQLPNLIFNAPTVPPGGGAEALPAGLFPHPSSLSWFSSPDGYNSSFPGPSAYHPQSAPSTSSSPQSATSSAFSLPPPPYSHPSPDSAPPPNPPPNFPHLPLSVPSALGLPIYSSSGFDLLSLLARVVTRPYPKIYLGPIDLSCSFVVTDTRRFDSPIVYASPTFLKLTGYEEYEVIGRNCRFLQVPGGQIVRGQDRMHTSREAVAHMRKNIVADKECQVSIINYRKDGSAFINMVSVIPLRGGVHNSSDEADDIVYHVGFQVDLTEQPKSILSKLKDGTYVVNYSDKAVSPAASAATRDWRTSSMTMRGMSKELRALLADSAFTASFQLSTSTHASTAIALSNNPSEPITLDPYDGNKPLHMFVLDRSPDFLHVVSLKGAFLYVAPAVRYVLGYDPDELVGRSLTEFCHPADCVPLTRELKEASATPGPSLLAGSSTTSPPSSSPSGSTNAANHDSPLQPSSPPNAAPRPVDLLFRMRAKGRGYVWVECRGRLHVEPGKGRKAIILCGRIRHMPHLEWGPISRAGGLVSPPPPRSLLAPLSNHLTAPDADDDPDRRSLDREFWGLLSTNATFLYVGAAVRDVLGWGAGEVIGKPLADIVSSSSPQEVHMAIEVEMTKILADAGGGDSSGLVCDIVTKDGNAVPVHIVFYRSRPPPPLHKLQQQDAGPAGLPDNVDALGNGGDPAAQPPIVCQVKRCDGSGPPPTNPIVHSLSESVFDETDLDRRSSWQYELQQLKFRNHRLAEEVASLEASIKKKIRRKQTSTTATSTAIGSSSMNLSGRSSTGPRMNITYAPTASGVPPTHSSPPLNVRFVSGSQGVPRGAAGTAAPHHTSSRADNLLPVSQQTPSSILPRTTPQLGHQAQMQQQSHQHIPQPPMPPPPAPPPQGYEHPQQSHPDDAVYAPPRMRQSTESSLQGWSSYGYDVTAERNAAQLGGLGAGGLEKLPPVSYNAVPMKRSWDDSLRDPGGGGA